MMPFATVDEAAKWCYANMHIPSELCLIVATPSFAWTFGFAITKLSHAPHYRLYCGLLGGPGITSSLDPAWLYIMG